MTSDYLLLGLFHDDVLCNYPDVLEAVRRLPGEVQDERNYRLLRAVQAHIRREFLPENEWTTYEKVSSASLLLVLRSV